MEGEKREVREGSLRLTTIAVNSVGFGWVFGAKKQCDDEQDYVLMLSCDMRRRLSIGCRFAVVLLVL